MKQLFIRLILLKLCLLTASAQYIYKQKAVSKEQLIERACNDLTDGDCTQPQVCESGVNQALADASAAQARYYYFSYPSPDYTSYLWVMQNVYRIKMVYGGEKENLEQKCYNTVIGEQMQQKFGKNFWMDVAAKADSLNNLGLSEKEMNDYIYCHLQFLPSKSGIAKVVVGCKTSSSGALIESRVVQSFSAEHDAEALRVIRSLPRWKPISQTLQIPVIFDEKLRKGCPDK